LHCINNKSSLVRDLAIDFSIATKKWRVNLCARGEEWWNKQSDDFKQMWDKNCEEWWNNQSNDFKRKWAKDQREWWIKQSDSS
jgi:hypothetical protein